MAHLAAWCPDHHNQAVVHPADCDEPVFLVVHAFVLSRKVNAIKDLKRTGEVQATLWKRFVPFGFIELEFH